MSDKLTEYFSQYEYEWLGNFLSSIFGKYRYVHTLSYKGLNIYYSNLRPVNTYHPDDKNCVSFLVESTLPADPMDGAEWFEGRTVKGITCFNMADFKDPDEFLKTFDKYVKLKAFL